jgi:plasmid stabilization system protein ParE
VSLRLVLRPEALDEISQAAAWYEGRATGLSAEFLRALDATLASLRRNPRQYPVVHNNLRRALLRRFPYSLIYTASDDEVVVVACAHGRQDPRRWFKRS